MNAAAIGSHLVGAAGLLVTDWPRVRHQQGVAKSSAIKTVTTGVGLGVAVWSAVLNRSMAKAGAVPVPVAGATEAGTATPPEVARTLRQLKLVQWLNPAAGLALIALSDWQSQQQRASEAAKGRTRRLLPGSVPAVPAGAVAGAVALGVLASRRRKPAGPPSPVELGVMAVDEVEIDIVQVDLIDPSVTPPPTPPIGGPGTPPRPAG